MEEKIDIREFDDELWPVYDDDWAPAVNAVAQRMLRMNRIFPYPRWDWRSLERNHRGLSFVYLMRSDDRGEHTIEGLMAYSVVGAGIVINYIATNPQNYYELRDQRRFYGAGSLLIAWLAGRCRELGLDRILANDVLVESEAFYRSLGFEFGPFNSRDRTYSISLQGVAALDSLHSERYLRSVAHV
jgi:GNAT superfamily N-acetyltransferase